MDLKKSLVSIKRVEEYDNERILQAMRECLEHLGGMSTFVKPGQRVLLKPNILGGFAPEKAVTTHPSVVRAAALLVREVGGEVLIGDSPGVQDSVSAARKAGIAQVAEEVGAGLADFKNTVDFDAPENSIGKHIALAQAVADADVIITLPKLKTHVQMLYTGAVKNQFGLVVGIQKARYHYRFKTREWLVRFILDINRIAKPALAIMDAVYGMEGNGPSGGEPRRIGALIAGSDLSAVDVVACSMINLVPAQVPTIKEAASSGFGASRLDQIDVAGEDWQHFRMTDFKQIQQQQGILLLPLPDFLQNWLRRRLAPRPRINKSRCIHCNACSKGCPVDPSAIDPSKSRKQVNDETCIRCYCCHEFCPEKAIDLRRFF